MLRIFFHLIVEVAVELVDFVALVVFVVLAGQIELVEPAVLVAHKPDY